MIVETFKYEIDEAIKVYEKFIICLDKPPPDFATSLNALVAKAIMAYESRGEGLRHGIALDRQVTVILSQSGDEHPLCGIYFNLHSPYQKKSSHKTSQTVAEKSSSPEG